MANAPKPVKKSTKSAGIQKPIQKGKVLPLTRPLTRYI
jgi:hypothetical protein